MYSLVLYLWQCLVLLPKGALALAWRLGGRRSSRGPGMAMLSLWPGARTFACGGYPFEIGKTHVYTESPKRFHRGGLSVSESRSQPLAGEPSWTARGRGLIGGAGLFFSGVSGAHVSHLAAFLNKLAEIAPEARAPFLMAELDAAFDIDACRDELAAIRRRTRWLRWICNTYAALIFILLPILLIGRSADSTWLALLPAVFTLHIFGLAALLSASLALAETPSVRFERVFVAALYPPALLRASIDLTNDRLAKFHPVTVASIVLNGNTLQHLLQITEAECTYPPWRRHAPHSVCEEAERQAFLDLLRTKVETLAQKLELDRHAASQDPTAASFCPLCLGEYRAGFDTCATCGIPTRPFGESAHEERLG